MLNILIPVDENNNRSALRISTESDIVLNSLQIEQYKMEFRVDYDEFCNRIRTYHRNLNKSYALIQERYTKGNAVDHR